MHPCDLYAISILDTVFRRAFPDPNFVGARNKAVIVALNRPTVGENCFCLSMGTGPSVKDAADLVLTRVKDGYLLETGSPKGVRVVSEMRLEPAPNSLLLEKSAALEETRRHVKKQMNRDDLRAVLEDNFRNPIWDELQKNCLGCGSCTMVCPTCFCYNVIDKLDLDLRSGRRQREWDSCMLLEYAEVALGANFRKDRDARVKQWMYHKLAYYEPQFGTVGVWGAADASPPASRR